MSQVDRYHRQTLLPQIGRAGQEKLSGSRVLLVGSGALGTVIADQLARAGVGYLRIVDRDIVELTNLQRQVLFDESDVQESLPKAIAAARKLARVNSSIMIEPNVVDVSTSNVETLMSDVELVVDATDNVATRYLLNDAAVKLSKPWIYGACVGTEGRVMTIRPTQTPCLRCVFPNPPAPGELPTCDTAGVLGPAAAVVASLQSVACIKVLTAQFEAIANQMLAVDLWSNRFRAIDLSHARRQDCPTCALRRFEFLDSAKTDSASLCGRNAVQIRPSGGLEVQLPAVELKLRPFGETTRTPYFVRCSLHEAPLELTVFPDGRTIVHGTSDATRARSIYARYLGT
jgi:adenylyltransferase/sulfurtransferase